MYLVHSTPTRGIVIDRTRTKGADMAPIVLENLPSWQVADTIASLLQQRDDTAQEHSLAIDMAYDEGYSAGYDEGYDIAADDS